MEYRPGVFYPKHFFRIQNISVIQNIFHGVQGVSFYPKHFLRIQGISVIQNTSQQNSENFLFNNGLFTAAGIEPRRHLSIILHSIKEMKYPNQWFNVVKLFNGLENFNNTYLHRVSIKNPEIIS